jgi:hypothetical protein
MAGHPRILRDGIVAGLLGAGTVAGWYLLLDALAGVPLRTPARLGAVLLHGSTGALSPASMGPLALQYTLVHVAAFLLIGVVAATLLALAEREPPLLLGLLIFLGGFLLFFVALVVYRGPVLTTTIPWWSVLAANLLAAAVMLTYFFVRHRRLAATLLGPWAGVVGQGCVAGLIGAVTVACWFLVYDATSGRPLYTPTLLAGAVLEGMRNPLQVHPSALLILGYSVFHGAVFILFGIAVAALLAGSEREPLLLLAVLLLFTTFEVFFIAVVMLIDEALVASIGAWSVLVANLLATVTMFGYLLSKHRGIGRRFRARWAARQATA